jgi:hypothetical protein
MVDVVGCATGFALTLRKDELPMIKTRESKKLVAVFAVLFIIASSCLPPSAMAGRTNVGDKAG